MDKATTLQGVLRNIVVGCLAGVLVANCGLKHHALPRDLFAEPGGRASDADQGSTDGADGSDRDASDRDASDRDASDRDASDRDAHEASDVAGECNGSGCVDVDADATDVTDVTRTDATRADVSDVFEIPDVPGTDATADVSGGNDVSSVDGAVADAFVAQANYRTDPNDVRDLAIRGRSNGSAYTLGCAASEVAVGITGQSDNQISAIGLRCSALLRDGSLSSTITDTQQVGERDEDAFRDRCPEDQVVVGLSGYSADVIYQLGIVCARPREWSVTATPLTILGAHGDKDGMAFQDLCPIGYVLTSLSVRSGGEIKALQGRCVRILP